MLFSFPRIWQPRRVSESVSTLDILPTLVDIVGSRLIPGLPMDGASIVPYLRGGKAHDNVFAEYMGEGTIAPMMMIRRGAWKYITCPADPDMLYNLADDPDELINLTKSDDAEIKKIYDAFVAEAKKKWNIEAITSDVVMRQRQRRFCFSALKQGKWTSWDYDVPDNSQDKYIRSHMDLDDLERRARYPIVDAMGHVKMLGAVGKHGVMNIPLQAGALGQ
jgi:hypothetical protein